MSNSSDLPRSAKMLAEIIIKSPGLLDKSNPDAEKIVEDLAEKTTKYIPTPALIGDKWLYRTVVLALGIVATASIIGAIILSAESLNVPEVITALGSAAIGALAGLLAPSPAGR